MIFLNHGYFDVNS